MHISKKSNIFAPKFNSITKMRFVLLIVWALLALLAIYYATVIAHLFTGMFGKNVDFAKTLIPFYGWTIWFQKLD